MTAWRSLRPRTSPTRIGHPTSGPMVMRLDGTIGLMLTELRAIYTQYNRLANRVGRLEEEREKPEL